MFTLQNFVKLKREIHPVLQNYGAKGKCFAVIFLNGNTRRRTINIEEEKIDLPHKKIIQ